MAGKRTLRGVPCEVRYGRNRTAGTEREAGMRKFLIVVDMQKDFVDGALGTAEAQAIVPAVVRKIAGFDGEVIATLDTHGADYMDTA